MSNVILTVYFFEHHLHGILTKQEIKNSTLLLYYAFDGRPVLCLIFIVYRPP